MFKKFLNDTAGNFSAMAAASILVLLGGVGLSVDYMGMTQNSSRLQAVVDGAALAAALSGEDDEEKVKAIGNDRLAAFSVGGNVITNPDYTFSDTTLRLTAQTSYTPQIMSIFGFGSLTVSASAEVPLSSNVGLDIALVLDVTDSMRVDDKIGDMKAAVQSFVNQIEGASDDVRISIIPFSQYVNVGEQYANEIWIDNSEEGTNFPAITHITTPRTCPVERVSSTCTRTRDSIEFIEECAVCPVAQISGDPVTIIEAPLRDWDGCVGSRPGARTTQPNYGGVAFPAVYDDGRTGEYRDTDYGCPAPLLPLTNNLTSVRSNITALNTRGTTYMPSGLAWGWRTLDDAVPLGLPIAGDNDRKKILIMMTDGHNTVSRLDNDKYHYGEASDDATVTDDANDLTAQICTNIALTDISVYTIAYALPVGADSDATTALLRNCVTSPDGFFSAADGVSLNTAFSAIARSLIKVRLLN